MEFRYLQTGDKFLWRQDVYIKIEPVILDTFDTIANSVLWSHGKIVYLNPDTQITRLNNPKITL